MIKNRIHLIIILIIAILFGCADSREVQKHTVPTVAQTTSLQACLGSSNTITHVRVVKSLENRHSGFDVYYVGAIFEAEGYNEEIEGLWLMFDNHNGTYMIYSIDGNAEFFSGMALAKNIKYPAYISDSESKTLIAYLAGQRKTTTQ